MQIPASVNGSPLLDLGQLETFIILGYEDYADLLNDVVKDVPGYLSTILTTILAGDAQGCSAAAHSCRGMLSYFGCVSLTERLAVVESYQTVEPSQAHAIHDEISALWTKSLIAIRGWEQTVPDFAP